MKKAGWDESEPYHESEYQKIFEHKETKAVISDFLGMLSLVIQYMGGAILGGFVALVLGAVLAVMLDVIIDLAMHGRGIRAKAAKEVRPVSVVVGLFSSAVVAAAMLLTVAKRFGWF